MGTLYIVPTPIGNLEDITLRAIRVLQSVGTIAAEDTRVTRKLLNRYDIKTPMTSFHLHSGRYKIDELVGRLASEDVALVSDAGTPTINDPGQELISAAVATGCEVVALPGASAVTTALSVSGIESEGFVYVGFLPRRKGDRVRLLNSNRGDHRALVAFETPHRLAQSLIDVLDSLGDRRIAVCRELTKLHEEVFRGSVSEAISHFEVPRGEFTLIIEGSSEPGAISTGPDVPALLAQLKAKGLSRRDAVEIIGPVTELSKRELYSLWLGLEDL